MTQGRFPARASRDQRHSTSLRRMSGSPSGFLLLRGNRSPAAKQPGNGQAEKWKGPTQRCVRKERRRQSPLHASRSKRKRTKPRLMNETGVFSAPRHYFGISCALLGNRLIKIVNLLYAVLIFSLVTLLWPDSRTGRLGRPRSV